MDASFLYTNIDQKEGADDSFKKLKEIKNKSIPSIVIKSLILMMSKSNAY